MAVYFQFKSSIVKESIPIDGPFINVGDLKESIIERKRLRRGKRRIDSDLVISDYDTKVDYLDDGALIPCYTTVLVRRVPVQASFPIIVNPPPVPAEPEEPEVVEMDPDDLEWEELLRVINSDPFEPESFPSQSRNPLSTDMDEDSKIKALVETPALDWGRLGGRAFGGKTPPQGYVCHRCKVAGHFIQYCPTNGDPAYDIKRLRPPTGIPKSMLVATPDGSYALPTGAVAVLRPNEAAFDKAMEGVPSSACSVGHLPPELHCRLCKKVMKDAVLTSRCCFDSFCDRCIRERIITKSGCVCGETNVLADDLIPNVTLRNTISRILESKSSSSSTGEAADKQGVAGGKHESVSVKESAPAASQASAPLADEDVQQRPVSDKAATKKAQEGAPAASQENAPLADEDVQQRPVSDEAAKKKARMPTPVAAENNMMSMGAYNPYWGGMQPGMNGFMPPYAYVAGYGYGYGYGYGFGAMNIPFGEQGMMASGMESNAEARRANGKRKRGTESARDSQEAPKDRSGNMSSSSHHLHRRHPDRPCPVRRSRDHYRDSERSCVSDHPLDTDHHHDRHHPRRSSSHHRSGRLYPQGVGLGESSSRIRVRD